MSLLGEFHAWLSYYVRWRLCGIIFLTALVMQANFIILGSMHLYKTYSTSRLLQRDHVNISTEQFRITRNTLNNHTFRIYKDNTNNSDLDSQGASEMTTVSSDPPTTEPVTTARPQPPNNTDTPPVEFLATYKNFCEKNTNGTKIIDSKPLCPCVPPGLVGPLRVTTDNTPLMGEMELKHTELKPGGRWQPPNCTARYRIAIIVPFRDREEHLRIFLNHMHPVLQRQHLDYSIFIVEQYSLDVFNKAMMMNIGFMEANKLDKFDCFIFHDVDMLVEDDRSFFTCSDQPRHVAPFLRKWNYILPYKGLFGGATAFKSEQFKYVNGFSNAFFGWGGEDDDMFRRVVHRHFKIVRYPSTIARYTMIKHKHDSGNPYNKNSNVAWQYRPRQYEKDGLNSLQYKCREIEYRPLYTWISAEVGLHPRFAWYVRNSYNSVHLHWAGWVILPLVVWYGLYPT